MATVTLTAPPEAPSPGAAELWRLTLEQYHEMVSRGILGEYDPVELLDGLLMVKMPKNRAHSNATRFARQSLAARVPAGWYVDSQEPVSLESSEPEPDVVVVRDDPRALADRHTGPAEIGLVVEVADTSLERDRALKGRLYAAARLPVYWILNLAERCVEAYSDPAPPGESSPAAYAALTVYGADDSVPLVLDGTEVASIPVSELLP
jgi:Uma2 family endonuclease